MTSFEKLKKYQLALAMPVILSGIKTSAVMIIGTATLAALIGAGGLGSFILLGIDRRNASLLIIGALSSAVLAIFMNTALKYLEKKSVKTVIVSFLIVSLALIGTFLQPYSTKMTNQTENRLVIAGKLGAEPEILMNMYRLLIEQDTSIQVELLPNFGKTTFLYEALLSGKIDMYPEFTGTVVTTLLRDKPAMSTDEAVVYKQAREGLYAQDKLIYLEPMLYQNTYALAVRKEDAQAYQLETISDLKKIESKVTAGFSLEFTDRKDGNKGLNELYQLDLLVKTMEPALRYEAIVQKQVDVIDVYTTDSQLIVNDLLTLKDDKHLFPPYQVAPLLKEETLKKYPEIKSSLNKLANLLTDEEMKEMNYQVDINNKSAHQVAEQFLKSKGLLKE